MVSWDSNAGCGWSVIRLTPVSTKVLPAGVSGLVPSGELRDGVDALLRHLQRVLLRGGADLARLDRLDARAAAVDRDDRDVVLRPAAFSASYAPAAAGSLIV